MNHDEGGQVATRNIPCVKEFRIAAGRRGTKLIAPHFTRNWGLAKPGLVLSCRAKRTYEACARGVHAWRVKNWQQYKFRFAPFGSRVAWHCVIPRGTWYHISVDNDKYRADAIRLVREVKGSRT